MSMETLIPLNTVEMNPELRGAIPLVMEMHEVSFTLASGTKTVTVDSSFGKDKGEVLGVLSLNTSLGVAKNLGFVAVEGANTGEVRITVDATSSSVSDSLTTTLFLVGRIHPTNPA